MQKSNVLDLTKKLKKSLESKTTTVSESKELAKVLNMQQRLEEKQSAEKRQVTRTVLSQFIGVFVVLKSGILQPVSVYDISIDGLAFDMVQDIGSFDIGESLTLRIYMSHDTYFSFAVQVANSRLVETKGVNRHGAIFKKIPGNTAETGNGTLYHFVRFLESVSVVAKKDKGEKVSGRVD